MTVPLGASTVVQWGSNDGSLIWGCDSGLDYGDAFDFDFWATDDALTPSDLLEDYRWTWQFYGIGVIEARAGRETAWIVPYLCVVVPLTLLSLILLTGNPRSRAAFSKSPRAIPSDQIDGTQMQSIPR